MNRFCSVFLKDPGAAVSRGSCGEDVVHQKHGGAGKGRGVLFIEGKSSFKIGETLLAGNAPLGQGGAVTDQTIGYKAYLFGR